MNAAVLLMNPMRSDNKGRVVSRKGAKKVQITGCAWIVQPLRLLRETLMYDWIGEGVVAAYAKSKGADGGARGVLLFAAQ